MSAMELHGILRCILRCGNLATRLLCRIFLLLSIVIIVAQHNYSTGFAGEATPPAPLTVVEIAPGIFVAEGAVALVAPANGGHIANLGFIVGETGVAVIDTGGSFLTGRRMLASIREQTDLPIRFVINTHAHPDHMFGNAAFADIGATFVAHHRFNAALAQRGPHYLAANLALLGEERFAGTILTPATRGVDTEMILDLGEREIRLLAHATGHTDNDLSIIDDKTGTAFLGDLLFVRHVPALDGSLRGWVKTMKKLRTQEFDRVVPGHGPASIAWPQALAPQMRYLNRLAKDLKASIANGASINEASRQAGLDERDAWDLFDEFNMRNATTGFAELEWE